MLNTLHTLFEVQYTELALAVDEIAERIRALGAPAPGSHEAFQRLAKVKDAGSLPDALGVIAQLAKDQDTISEAARQVIEDAGDPASADLGTRRIDLHQKNAWMLRSHLE